MRTTLSHKRFAGGRAAIPDAGARPTRPRRVSSGFRLTLDLALAVLLAVSLGARLTETAAHEWIGLIFAALAVLHVWLNRRWFPALRRGRYTLRRTANLAVIAAMAILFLLLCWGGLLNSQFVLGFLDLPGGLGYREVHTFTAYWLLVMSGVHLGLQWPLVGGWLRKRVPPLTDRPTAKTVFRLLSLAIAAAGLWAAHDRDLSAKLFQGFGFGYWDPQRPGALFYLAMLCIMGLCAVAAHGAMRLANRFRGRAKEEPCGKYP